jgi:endonuclease-3
MTITAKKAKYIISVLDKLYPNPPIPLDHSDSYTLLIAVILSAQCTDVRVNQVTKELFRRADTPKKMVKLGIDNIQEIIRPCGLSARKAEALYTTSLILLEKFDGEVPATFEELEKLPGVGHKTASVVMSQAFQVPAFPVDTHIHRLAKRWGLSSGKNVVQTERDLKEAFPKSRWNKLHLQIIFYGREFCSARGCDGKTCRICSHLNSKS